MKQKMMWMTMPFTSSSFPTTALRVYGLGLSD